MNVIDIPYIGLNCITNVKAKKIILKHLKNAGKLNKWYNIGNFLQNQFHKRKFERKLTKKTNKYNINDDGVRYEPNDTTSNKFYSNYLYFKRKMISDMSPFPCDFKSCLEDVFFDELSSVIKRQDLGAFDTTHIYYCHSEKPKEIKFDAFDENEWILDECENMTDNDIQILENYKNGLIEFMNESIELCKPTISEKRLKSLIKEKTRCEKVMSV
jgi:hypothetical protein